MLLSLHGAKVVGAASPAEGLAALQANAIDVVIQDMNFRREATGGEEGIALFHEIRRRFPDMPIILLTAWTHLETAVDLVRGGAADYVAKPWDDDRLLTTVRNLLDLRSARTEAQEIRADRRAARDALTERFDLCAIVYREPGDADPRRHGDPGQHTPMFRCSLPARTAPVKKCWPTSCRLTQQCARRRI